MARSNISAESYPKKKSLIAFKGHEITSPSDYRAFLAFLLVAGYLYVLILGNAIAIAGMGPLTGSAVAYYFHSRPKRNVD